MFLTMKSIVRKVNTKPESWNAFFFFLIYILSGQHFKRDHHPQLLLSFKQTLYTFS